MSSIKPYLVAVGKCSHYANTLLGVTATGSRSKRPAPFARWPELIDKIEAALTEVHSSSENKRGIPPELREKAGSLVDLLTKLIGDGGCIRLNSIRDAATICASIESAVQEYDALIVKRLLEQDRYV